MACLENWKFANIAGRKVELRYTAREKGETCAPVYVICASNGVCSFMCSLARVQRKRECFARSWPRGSRCRIPTASERFLRALVCATAVAARLWQQPVANIVILRAAQKVRERERERWEHVWGRAHRGKVRGVRAKQYINGNCMAV